MELYCDIFDRLNAVPAVGEDKAFAEYSWDTNKIYLYTNHHDSEEDVIRSLIHECVHSNQSHELYEAYCECKLDYETHPHEIEAEYEEEKWKKYKIKESDYYEYRVYAEDIDYIKSNKGHQAINKAVYQCKQICGRNISTVGFLEEIRDAFITFLISFILFISLKSLKNQAP